jgi:2-oxoisovalerate dehydrogenase E1 component
MAQTALCPMPDRPFSNRVPLPDGLDAERMVGLYRDMVLLRKFELAAQVACRKGETPGFLHLYIGQEATASGVCAHLKAPTGSRPLIVATAMRSPRAWTPGS